jgi:hypothetical protein
VYFVNETIWFEGFFPEEVYTKKDILNFLDKPASTLNSGSPE